MEELDRRRLHQHLNSVGRDFWVGLYEEPVQVSKLQDWANLGQVTIREHLGLRRCEDGLAFMLEMDCHFGFDAFADHGGYVDEAIINTLVKRSMYRHW